MLKVVLNPVNVFGTCQIIVSESISVLTSFVSVLKTLGPSLHRVR